MTVEELKSLASERLLNCEDGSPSWCYWRGMLLGLEANNPKNLILPDWPDKVLMLAVGGRSP